MNRDEEWLLNEKYHGERTDEFFVDCERLKSGEPLAYVIGHVPFLGTTIFLDSRPLIPRAETEFWVEKILADISGQTPTMRVLDLCAGSGCIGVAVLKALPHSRVDFAEIDAGHHPTIQKNIEANDIETSRTRIFGGDLFEFLNTQPFVNFDAVQGASEACDQTVVDSTVRGANERGNAEMRKIHERYDFILANPPYIDKTLGRTADSVLTNEPHLALFADDAGLALIRRIIENAHAHLAPGGILVIEHEPEQSSFIQSFGHDKGYTAETKLDQYGVERFTTLTRVHT